MADTRRTCLGCKRIYWIEEKMIDAYGYATWRNHFYCGPVCCANRRDELKRQEEENERRYEQ